MSFSVRPFIPVDREIVLALLPRLSDMALLPWRKQSDMDAFNQQEMQKVMDEMPADAVLLIAEDEMHTPAGFIYLTTEADFFNGENKGYISDLVVASQYEGQGVGRLLLAAAEDWTREKGYNLLTLYVLAGNERARRVYEKMGYSEEVVKYVKLIE